MNPANLATLMRWKVEASRRHTDRARRRATIDRRISCEGKVAYEDAAHAAQAQHSIRAKGGKHMHAYLCPLCGRWHLTKKARKYQVGSDRRTLPERR